MLIGSYSKSLFLVHSESLESEYVASRPFRVNAGPVQAYVMVLEIKQDTSQNLLQETKF